MSKKRLGLGAVGRFFTHSTTWIYHAVSTGIIGKILTAYPGSEGIVGGSYVTNVGRVSNGRGRRKRYNLRRSVACAMERNVLSRVTGCLLRGLGDAVLRTYGVFFIAFSAFSAIMYLLAATVWHNDLATWENLIAAACVFPVGVVLLFSERTLSDAIYYGRLGRFFGSLFGLTDDGIPPSTAASSQEDKLKIRAMLLASALGIVLGLIGIAVRPWLILAGAIAVPVAVMVLSVPESGMVLFWLYVPFVGFVPYGKSLLLLLSVLFLSGYTVKLLRGNRVLQFEAQDIPVCLLVLFFGASAMSVAGGDAPYRALMNLILVLTYFPMVNIIATGKWLLRCRIVLAISAVSGAISGILQFIYAAVTLPDATGVDMALLGDAVKAGFRDHTTFSYFLVIAFAITFPSVFTARRGVRVLVALACLMMTAAVVLAWVQSAWIALLLSAAIFALIAEKRSFPFLFLGSGVLTGTYFLLPQRLQGVIGDFLREASARALSRNDVTNAVLNIFFGAERLPGSAGISRFIFGLGNGGLEALYPVFGATGTKFINGACNFWLALCCEFGVPGAVVTAVLFFAVLQNAFSVLWRARYREKPTLAYSGVCLIAAVLSLSFARSAWYDPAALAVFFAAIALVGAGLRYDRRSHFDYVDVIEERFSAECEYRA